ncbi:MAG: V-type ATP synthase subunit I [Marinilabiliaceae bacterium]|nr:V-type ATP synthase subunit I [Marinilabiliaceae bacterium]
MKKYSFLIYYKTYNEFLEKIAQAGVVHIVEKQKGIPEDATELRQQLMLNSTLKSTIHIFKQRIEKQKNMTALPYNPNINGMDVINEYEQLKSTEEKLSTQRQTLLREIESMTIWGDFDLSMLEKIEKEGMQIKFYSCRDREFQEEWIEKFDAVKIAQKGSFIYFVTITKTDSTTEPEAEKMKIATHSLFELKTILYQIETKAEEVQNRITEMAVEHHQNLIEMQRLLHQNIDFNKVHLQTEKKAEEKLILLEGWVPEIKEQNLIEACENQDVYYIGVVPDKDDNSVPILLKNNPFSKLFEFIGELYDFPNYHELDLTPFFAPFYMLFFGLCLGDAGYGMLIAILALFARTKVKPSMKPIMSLAAILGAATTICGIVCGTFFGINLLEVKWEWIIKYQGFMLDDNNLFMLALILGGVQIVFGMIVKAIGQIRRYGLIYSLETWGWLILLLGGATLYLAYEEEMFVQARLLCFIIISVSGVLIFLFNSPGRNPFVNIGSGLWNTYNMVTGLLGDLLSYIRLFALGICGGVMGMVFNNLAMQMSGDTPIVSHLIMILILIVGHSLNIFMAGLGAFVHPMRLTFVEFYKNAGFEGGGKKYKPLASWETIKTE